MPRPRTLSRAAVHGLAAAASRVQLHVRSEPLRDDQPHMIGGDGERRVERTREVHGPGESVEPAGDEPTFGRLTGLDDRRPPTEEALHGLIAAYAVESKGYLSRAHPFRRGDSGPYDHLARVRHWAQAGDA